MTASATWPASLPTNFLVGTLSEDPPDNRVLQPMGIGPPKSRRTSTTAARMFGGVMHMTAAQLATFDTFYVDTLKSGSLTFDGLNNPRTGVEMTEVLFASLPHYSDAGIDEYDVQINLMDLS